MRPTVFKYSALLSPCLKMSLVPGHFSTAGQHCDRRDRWVFPNTDSASLDAPPHPGESVLPQFGSVNSCPSGNSPIDFDESIQRINQCLVVGKPELGGNLLLPYGIDFGCNVVTKVLYMLSDTTDTHLGRITA